MGPRDRVRLGEASIGLRSQEQASVELVGLNWKTSVGLFRWLLGVLNDELLKGKTYVLVLDWVIVAALDVGRGSTCRYRLEDVLSIHTGCRTSGYRGSRRNRRDS